MSVLRVKDAFDRLGSEHEQPEDRGIEIKRSAALDDLLRVFEQCSSYRLKYNPTWDNYRDNCDRKVNSFSISPEYLPHLSIMLSSYQDIPEFRDLAGIYLSACAKRCVGTEVVIPVAHFSERINGLGERNESKKIIIKGDVNAVGGDMSGGEITVFGNGGTMVGNRMIGGKITVHGDCEELAAYCMKDGLIHVRGDVGEDAGMNMRGGRLVVDGSAGAKLGYNLLGGQIYVYGDIANLGDCAHLKTRAKGEIYHKDRLIWKDGVRIE